MLKPETNRLGYISTGDPKLFPPPIGNLVHTDAGVELQVPFLHLASNDNQLAASRAEEWFDLDDQKLPQTLLFEDNIGSVTLCDNRITQIQRGRIGLGSIRPGVVIFGRPLEVREECLTYELRSAIDGLSEFTGFEPIRPEGSVAQDDRQVTRVTLDPAESVSWQTDGFEYELKSSLSWTSGKTLVIDDDTPRIITRSLRGEDSVYKHFAAHRPIRALLVLLHGSRLRWRSHWLCDDQFPVHTLGGASRHKVAVRVYLQTTLLEHHEPSGDERHAALLPFGLSDIGSVGMRRWTELYPLETFRRAAQPAVEVMNGASAFLEPQLMMLAISLDYFGYFHRGKNDRRPMAENIEYALEFAGFEREDIGSNASIAQAISQLNNDIKHPDREAEPNTLLMAGLVRIARAAVRSQLFRLLEVDEERLSDFLKYDKDLNYARDVFESAGIALPDRASRTSS